MNQNTKALAVAAKAGSIAKAAFPSFARHLFLLALVAFFVLVFFLWLQGAEQSLEVAPQPKAVEAAQAALPDPCGLTDVVCPDEAPTAPVAPQGKPGKTEVVEISCYTGIESHGANGRNPWSVATYRYPQGTRLHIEGFGEKVVETVTAKRFSHRIDVWFGERPEDYERCWQFGIQKLNVTVL